MIGERINLSGQRDAKSGALGDIQSKVRSFFFADPAQPQKSGAGHSQFFLIPCESLQCNSVWHNAQHTRNVTETICLRHGNAVEAYVFRDALKQAIRIEMPGQMERGQHRHINFACARPKAPGLVMNQVKSPAFAGALMHQRNHPVLMFLVAPLKIVRLRTGFAGNKQFAADSRTARTQLRLSPARALTFHAQGPRASARRRRRCPQRQSAADRKRTEREEGMWP